MYSYLSIRRTPEVAGWAVVRVQVELGILALFSSDLPHLHTGDQPQEQGTPHQACPQLTHPLT